MVVWCSQPFLKIQDQGARDQIQGSGLTRWHMSETPRSKRLAVNHYPSHLRDPPPFSTEIPSPHIWFELSLITQGVIGNVVLATRKTSFKCAILT